jgi:hypothetical protein
MALGAQLPVRLETDVEERLETIAQQVGTTKSALIRLLARTFVEECVDEKGRVSLPPNWKSLAGLADPDDRTRYPHTNRAAATLNETPAGKNKGVVNLLPDPNLPAKIKNAADALTKAADKKIRHQHKSKTNA